MASRLHVQACSMRTTGLQRARLLPCPCATRVGNAHASVLAEPGGFQVARVLHELDGAPEESLTPALPHTHDQPTLHEGVCAELGGVGQDQNVGRASGSVRGGGDSPRPERSDAVTGQHGMCSMGLEHQARHPEAQTLVVPASTSSSSRNGSAHHAVNGHRGTARREQAHAAAWGAAGSSAGNGQLQQRVGAAAAAAPRAAAHAAALMAGQAELTGALNGAAHGLVGTAAVVAAAPPPCLPGPDSLAGGSQDRSRRRAPPGRAGGLDGSVAPRNAAREEAAGSPSTAPAPAPASSSGSSKRAAQQAAAAARAAAVAEAAAANELRRSEQLRWERHLTWRIGRVGSWGELAELALQNRGRLNGVHIAAMLSRLERQQLADPHEPAQQARRGGSGSGGRRRWSPSPPGARQQQLAEAYGEEPSAGSSGRGSSSYPAAAGRGTGARGADGRPDAHGSSPPPPLPVALRKFPTPAHLGRCLLREAERCLSGEAPPVTLPAPPPPPPRADVVYQTDSVSKRIKAKRARAAARAASGPARTPHKRAASSSLRLRELSSVLASAVRLGLPLGRQSVIRFMTAAFHGMWPVAAEAAEQTAVEEAAEAAAAAAAEQPAGVGQQAAEDMQRAEHFAHSAQKQAAARAGGGGRSGGGGSGGSSSDVTAQALTELIWAVSWLGMSRLRTDWGARYLQCVRARSHAYSPQGTAVTLQALARLQCMPPLDTRTRLLTVLVRDAEAGRCCPPDVSMTLWALARLKCGPPPGLGTRLLSATQAQLPRFTAQEMANTIWGCAKLRLAPPAPWVRTLLDTAPRVMLHGEREGGGGGGRATQALSTTLYAMAVLQLRPEEAWLSACVKWTAQHIHEFTPQGLACIVYACALMGYCPSKAWLSSFHRVASAAPDADVHPATHTMLANAYAILGFVPPDPLHGDGPPPSWAESLCEPHAQQQQQQRRVVYHDDRALGTSPLSPALGQASGDYDGAGADTVGSRSGGGWHLDQRGGGSARRQHSSVTRPSAPPLRATLP